MQPLIKNPCLSKNSIPMKTRKITLVTILTLCIASFSFGQKTINKSFSGIKDITLTTGSGNGIVKKSSSQEVKVTLYYTYNDDDYKPNFEQSGDRLIIDEEFSGRRNWNVRGRAEWTLEVPDGIELEFKTGSGNIDVDGVNINVLAKSGSGNIEINNLEGKLRINTGSGNIDLSRVIGRHDGSTGSGEIRIDRSEGDARFSTGSGNIRVRDISGGIEFSTGSGNIDVEGATIKNHSRVSTGSGNAEVVLSSVLDYDINLSTGSGNVTLDFNGNKIEGEFTLESSEKSDIRAPFRFNNEYDRGRRYIKEAKIGSKNIEVSVKTGSGRAVIRE